LSSRGGHRRGNLAHFVGGARRILATIGGVRCRFNVMHTSRGVGFAVRLLATFQATIER